MSGSIVFLLSLIVLSTSLYTSSYFKKLGINLDQPLLTEQTPSATYLETQCNDVDLSTDSNYNYSGVVMSGYLNVKKGGSGLGFIFYGKQNAKRQELKNYPILIWLNGGPGSSSQLGNFLELGPFWLKPSTMKPFQITKNNHTWIQNYNVIFVDQPVGTGLSWADPNYPNSFVTSMDDVADDFYYALTELYTNQNGCFKKIGFSYDHPLFLFGESYAGKYAPAIANRIVQKKKSGGFLTGLRGVGIGDGFTHPFDILSQVGEFAFNMGLIDYQERTVIEQIILNATYQVQHQRWTELHDSFDQALDLIVMYAGDINVYDITKYQDYPDQIIKSYLQSPDTIKRYKLNPDVKFAAQAGEVYKHLFDDFMKIEVHLVEALLQNQMNVLIYNGQNDLIVETPGTFKWVQRLHYAHADQFRQTLFTPWKVDGKVAGYHKIVGRLELRTVNNAGHLVPMDQGEAALHMVNHFIARSL